MSNSGRIEIGQENVDLTEVPVATAAYARFRAAGEKIVMEYWYLWNTRTTVAQFSIAAPLTQIVSLSPPKLLGS
jgi:hypothetical protein